MVHITRTARGAVHFFNPAGLGGVSSTLRWRVLSGCEEFATAREHLTKRLPGNAAWRQAS